VRGYAGGVDLIRWIEIRQSGSKRAGLTSLGGFDRGVDAFRAVGWRSGGSDLARAAGGGAQQAATRDTAARGDELAGAEANRRYPTRFGLRFAPKRRARHGEAIRRSAVDWVWRRRRVTRRGDDERRCIDGEPVPTTQGTGTAASSTGDFLTLRRRSGAVARRPGGGSGSGRRRRRNPRV
jgi:hypothetical protein